MYFPPFPSPDSPWHMVPLYHLPSWQTRLRGYQYHQMHVVVWQAVFCFPWLLSYIGCFGFYAHDGDQTLWGRQLMGERTYFSSQLRLQCVTATGAWSSWLHCVLRKEWWTLAQPAFSFHSAQDPKPREWYCQLVFLYQSHYSDNSPQAWPQIHPLDDSRPSWQLTLAITKGQVFPLCTVAKTRADVSLNSTHPCPIFIHHDTTLSPKKVSSWALYSWV